MAMVPNQKFVTADARNLAIVLAVSILLWLPRCGASIDMRWDGAVYYLLGTSLAEGTGYRLLNEPGEIQGIQYPPLLPCLVAAHQKALGRLSPGASSLFRSLGVRSRPPVKNQANAAPVPRL